MKKSQAYCHKCGSPIERIGHRGRKPRQCRTCRGIQEADFLAGYGDGILDDEADEILDEIARVA